MWPRCLKIKGPGPVVKSLPCNGGDRVQSLVGEDPTCDEELSPCTTITEPVLQSLGTTEPMCCHYRSPGPLEPVLRNEKPLQ